MKRDQPMTRNLLLFFSLLAACNFTAAAAVGPTDTVKVTIDQVLVALADKTIDEPSRKDRVLDLITLQFDFPDMSQRILATNWKNASEAQKNQFVELFTRLLANTYWVRVKDYRDEKVEYLGEKIVDDRLARVKTQIVTETVKIPIDYSLKRNGDRWRAYDVTIEGVSLVRTYRTTYQQIAKQDGIDGLLAQMQAKVAESENP